ncbi:MAG: VWA domain-containing protein [Gammaproteobacteria bacterium]|nr:VWA domain-containing protein [Gammaproteobacteria bacterium]MCY4274177.1 VWA domain-containing protein [Gammaproteobacteria bacterium]
MQKSNQPLLVQHLHYRLCLPFANRLICLLIDCSSSMLSRNKLSLAKGLVLQIARQVRQHRGKLAVIGFRNDQASILKRPDQHAGLDEHWIYNIQGGGATPLRKGIEMTEQFLQRYKRQFPEITVDLWLLTDGRFRDLSVRPKGAGHYIVIDFEDDRIRLAKARQLAQLWKANYWRSADVFEMGNLGSAPLFLHEKTNFLKGM